jgi:hypothetical protein
MPLAGEQVTDTGAPAGRSAIACSMLFIGMIS